MKRAISTFTVLTSVVVFTLTSAAAQEYISFKSFKLGFSMELPAGFKMDGREGKFTSWSLSPVEGEEDYGAVVPMISVTTTEIPSRYSPKTYYTNKLNSIKALMDDPDSTLDDLETLDFSGGYGLMVKDVIKNDPQALNHWFIHLYGNNRDYFIDISGTYGYLKDNRNSFKHVVDSFAIFK